MLSCTSQKVLTPSKNLHFSFYACICIKIKQKIYVIILTKGFTKDLGDAMNEFSFNEVFMQLRYEEHIRQSMIINRNIINTKFDFKVSYIFVNNII